MKRIGVIITVSRTENGQTSCSDLKLFCTNDEGVNNNCNVVLMIGLPYEMPNEVFQSFVEPFLPQILEYEVLTEVCEKPHTQDHLDHNINHISQSKKFAILSFENPSSKQLFVDYYNNMQVPLFSEVAPCLVLALDHIEVKFTEGVLSTNKLLLDLMQHNAFSRLSLPSPVIASGRTSRNYASSSPHTLPPHSPSHSSRNRLDTLDSSTTNTTSHPKVHYLPTCAVCLRRISNIGTIIPGAGDLKICRSYIYDNNLIAKMTTSPSPGGQILVNNSDKSSCNNNAGMTEFIRCFACYTYNTVSESKFHHPSSNSSYSPKISAVSPTINICMDCGLSDGIWLCMLCCHMGCGRYKGRHAQQHYLSSSHSLSLELASGLIWDYRSDAYVHVDDVTSLTHSSGSGGLLQRSSFVEDFNITDRIDSDDNCKLDTSFQSIAPASHSSSFLMGSKPIVNQNREVVKEKRYSDGVCSSTGVQIEKPFKNSLPSNTYHIDGEDVPMLDSITVDKMNHLISNYESLLQSQLNDQQMYFEKMLARESVRALELTYHHNSNTISTKKGTSQHISGTEFKSDDTTTTTSEEVFLDEEECDMRDIENVKIEISGIEAEYKRILDEIKVVEDENRLYKKKNDTIMKLQKALRDKEADYLLKEEAFKQRCASDIADLEQQIRDLTFYVKTRKQVQSSPLKEELVEGSVVVSSSNQSSSNSKNTRKAKK